MSTHKKIPKKTRLAVYEKCNHRCAYCGCDLKYEDMQVDHIGKKPASGMSAV